MMRRPVWLLALICAALLEAQAPALVTAAPAASAPPASQLAPGQTLPTAALEAFVDGAVRQSMTDHHIAGVTVSVVQDGRILLKKGYGFADLRPYRPVDPDQTLFRIGSISKTFTWILLLREVEAGHMRLDAPVNLYLPESLRIPDQGYSQPVRLRDLMNHTPGFEDRALGILFERDYRRVRALDTFLRQERPRRIRPPESLVSYSNYGAGLAGAAIAEVTGQTYEAAVERAILTPLTLSHTSFREPHAPRAGLPAPMAPNLAEGLSQAYRWTPDGWRQRPFEYLGQVAPAGAGSSTAGDMARYMLLLLGAGALDGVTVYGPRTGVALSTPLPRPAALVPAFRHGLMEQPLPGGFMGVGHGGATLSFHSNLTIVPALKLGVFISTNTDTGAPLAASLARSLVGAFYAPPPAAPMPGSVKLIADRADFEGVYRTDRRAYGGLEGFIDRLIGDATVKVTEAGRLLVSGDTRGWTPQAGSANGVFVSPDGVDHLVFAMSGGRATRFYAPGGASAYERVGLLSDARLLKGLTILAALAAVMAIFDLFARSRRDFRESTSQRRAGLIQSLQGLLWLIAMGLLAGWSTGAGDPAWVVYGWPPLALIIASVCGLIAAAMALLSLLLIPLVWRGGRRLDSWGALRKTGYTITTLIFLTYGALLASWGALEPWTG